MGSCNSICDNCSNNQVKVEENLDRQNLPLAKANTINPQKYKILQSSEQINQVDLPFNDKIMKLMPVLEEFKQNFFKQNKINDILFKERDNYYKFKKLKEQDIIYIYNGEIQNGVFEGIGTLYCEKYIYFGQFKNGEFDGLGIQIDYNGNLYQGQYKEGEKYGEGECILEDGTKFKGGWKNGKLNGQVKEEWTDSTYFEGNYVNGQRDGYGFLRLNKSDNSTYQLNTKQKFDTYKGEFKNNEFEGQGEYCWSNGQVYKGQWINGLMDGYGHIQYKDGRSYKGQFNNDLKNGYGEMTYLDGTICKGYWLNGKQDGEGIKVDSNGFEHRGIWKNGIKIEEEQVQIYV